MQQSLSHQAKLARSGLKALGAKLSGTIRSRVHNNRPSNRDNIALRAIPGCLRGGDAFAGQSMVRGLLRYGPATLDLNQPSPLTKLPARGALTTYVDRFEWLADLKTEGGAAATTVAIRMLESWGEARQGFDARQAETLDDTTTRLRTCLANSDVLLSDCDLETFERLHDVMANDIATIEARSASATTAPNERARALLALVLAGLVLDGCEDLVAAHEVALCEALNAAIRADGSPADRSRDTAIELVLDLIPVIRIYSYLERSVPTELSSARQRLMRYLKTLHISGTSFVGFGSVLNHTDLNIARVVKLESNAEPHVHAEDAGIVRCECGPLMVLADAGGPELQQCSAKARQSTGAIEIAFAHRPVITTRLATSCSNPNACHHYSTLQLDPIDALAPPDPTIASLCNLLTLEHARGSDTQIALEHDRYLASHGLMHAREIDVLENGSGVTGRERLYPVGQAVRFARDVPMVVHFQIAPEIHAAICSSPGEIELRLPEGQILIFASSDGQVNLETQTYASPDGSQQTALRIAIRKTTNGEADVTWRLTRAD